MKCLFISWLIVGTCTARDIGSCVHMCLVLLCGPREPNSWTVGLEEALNDSNVSVWPLHLANKPLALMNLLTPCSTSYLCWTSSNPVVPFRTLVYLFEPWCTSLTPAVPLWSLLYLFEPWCTSSNPGVPLRSLLYLFEPWCTVRILLYLFSIC